MGDRTYLAIDLKSFYASVECVERGLDPARVHLVVADESRTEKTICLAVSPALKAYGVPGRPRLFEVIERVKTVNAARRRSAPRGVLSGKSCQDEEVRADPSLALDFLIAPPRMSLYMRYSRRVFEIYKRFVSPEDIHVYSVDEVFMDVTAYLAAYRLSARELASKIVSEVFRETGITATAGVGSNLYLCKVAMDILAKHMPADGNGVRIAELDEAEYRRTLWSHRPLTDFWRVGPATCRKLEERGMNTMGDIARCSVRNEDLLYDLFGVNAELLIDHAWGWEPCTIAEIKAYRPEERSLGAGQVLQQPYPFAKGRLIVHEMGEGLAYELLAKGLVGDRLVLTVGYDRENLSDPALRAAYKGEIAEDRYGREIPKHAHGTLLLRAPTSSAREISEGFLSLYDRVVDPALLVRRMYLSVCRVQKREEGSGARQLDLFTDYAEEEERLAREKKERDREKSVQEAVLSIRKKFGNNALVKGMDMEEGATARERNGQIGGHKK